MSTNNQEGSDLVTLMYVPGRSGHIRRYNFPRTWIRRSMGAAVAVAVALLVLGVDYVRGRIQLTELEYLRNETREQRDELVGYADRMALISKDLQRISSFDRKLRMITNLDPAAPLPLQGIGGVEKELLDPNELTGLTRDSRQARMLEGFGALADAASAEADSLSALISHLERQSARLQATPSVSPTKGWMTSAFGYRTSPFTGNREFHRGLDIAGRVGTPVIAPADGTVRFSGTNGGLGVTVTLRHGFGIETRYGHLQEASLSRGDKVTRGQQIGLLGSTGRSTGPHLHYQVEVDGKPVNPKNYILD